MSYFVQNNGINPACIFLHIPKTGGTYLSHKIEGNYVLQPIKYLNHSYIVDNLDKRNPIYRFTNPEWSKRMIFPESEIHLPVFSVIRNIFDFFVSYAGHAGGWNPKYLNENHYDFGLVQKGFDYTLNEISQREDKWPNRKLIFCQLFSSSGNLIVDRINRNETLDADVAAMSYQWGLNYQQLKRERLGNRKDYKSYYNDRLIHLVEETWSRELKLFGYGFENSESNIREAILKRNVDSFSKKNVKYFYETDCLMVNGKRFE